MNLPYLFLSPDGRVGRAQFWRAATLLIMAELALAFALSAAARISVDEYRLGAGRTNVVNLVVIALFFWPSLILVTKRLHDRDTSGWWSGLLHGLLFMTYVNAAFRPLNFGRDLWVTVAWGWPVVVLIPMGAWLFIELVVLKGTRGDNQFGAAPDDGPTEHALPMRAITGAYVPKRMGTEHRLDPVEPSA